jgi:hypothetical protein
MPSHFVPFAFLLLKNSQNRVLEFSSIKNAARKGGIG